MQLSSLKASQSQPYNFRDHQKHRQRKKRSPPMADHGRNVAVQKVKNLLSELGSFFRGLKAQATAPQFAIGVGLAFITVTLLLASTPSSTVPSLRCIQHARSQFSGLLSFFLSGGPHQSSGSVESLIGCDLFEGEWVEDEGYPIYEPGSCAVVNTEFNCVLNGRPDKDYQKLRWKPKGCNLPRLNGADMLELLRGKRLVFVGDSLNRNMWESLVCILRLSVTNQSRVFEASGRTYFRGKDSFSFIFSDYNCSLEFFASPFLVEEWEVRDEDGTGKQNFRLDLMDNFSEKYKGADILVFNSGHWWNHEKTLSATFQEGDSVYPELDVIEAFHKALTTWASWVDSNVNRETSLVFFRGYSATHFRGAKLDYRGHCNEETAPDNSETIPEQYIPMMKVVETVVGGMMTPVTYLNITKMTTYRKDGHPSMYWKPLNLSDVLDRERFLRDQDCSHWCLPGVPDYWNEILYAELLVKLSQSSI